MTAHSLDHTVEFATRPPRSDVSPMVGLVGLAGLFAWILFCRNYAGFAEAFDLPGPREPLSGPYAALMALVFSAGPMIAWSMVVEKVHRRPSTGIDWDNPRPFGQVIGTSAVKVVGLWATFAIIAGLYMLGRWYWDGQYLFSMQVIGAAAVPIVLLTVPYVLWLDRYMVEPRDHSWHFGALLLRRGGWHVDEIKKHWRAWIIKAFFAAFMISILPGGFYNVVTRDLADIVSDPVRLGMSVIELLFVIDVQIGTVGYLVTMRPLDAQIRSGNPFLSGWLAALICYPPLVYAFMGGSGMIHYEVNTPGWAYWMEGHTGLLYGWAALLIALTTVYAWATVAFGLRFSNLTYRGVITNGPYRFTRHPAYLSKNLFWWCATLPFLVTSDSLTDMVRNTVFLAVVSGIYYWRARTEEAHLLAEDPKYREYYAWMEHNGVITSAMSRGRKRLGRLLFGTVTDGRATPAG
ncbi:isoprenylcysteine carboxylmethyltransferase family protein [Qipengyuania sp. JC766]|uniref:methyltransferase family protein n=1 Tax=Qipengyuania sp. JC766 TaxID=3232139 RepID=UPI00345AF96A